MAKCKECLEQARLLGMSAEREVALRAEIERLRAELEWIVENIDAQKAPLIVGRARFALHGVEQSAPDWPPQHSAIGIPDGERRYGSTGQIFEARNGVWVRL